jgi:hypothetical protein
MIATVVLLALSGSMFALISQVQRRAGYQAEIQGVLENTRLVMETIQRCLQQAGNDPRKTGFPGLTVVSATEVIIRSDITGSAGPGDPDKGDPDGDTDDSGENVTIRYQEGTRTVELIAGGAAQPIANNISALALQYFDHAGAETNDGAMVRRVRITLTGTSPVPDPQTRQVFSMQIAGDILILGRQ